MKKILFEEKKIICITLIIVLLISIAKKVYIFEFKYEEKNEKIVCMVIEKIKLKEENVSYLVKYDSNKFILNIYSKNFTDDEFNEYINFKYGDVLVLRGKINKIEKLGNPYEFDYKKYLNSNNIVTTITAYGSIKLANSSIGNPIFKICYFLKDCIGKKIDEKMPEKEAQLYKSMIYGDNQNLSEDIKESFEKNGMNHMLAVSGMHLMYLILIIDIVLGNIDKKKIKYIYIAIIGFYCIISGISMSAIRASIMSMLCILGKNQNKSKKYTNLIISYIIIVIYNPYSIFNVSGILSYLATIGILTFNTLINSFFEVILKLPKWSKYIYNILAITISSLILLFPVQIYYFGYIELRLFISCIFTNFISSSMYFLGFMSFFLMFVPIISDILFNATYFFTHILIFISDIISNINIPSITLPKPSLIEMYMYYISICFLVCKKYIVLIKNKDIKRFTRKFVYIFCIITFLIIFLCSIYRIYFEEYVIYFNVGQGNMAIIRKNMKVIVVDIGSTTENIAANILNQFLKAKAIKKIDLVLLTHMHTDHINGIYNVNAKIEKVSFAIPKEETEEFNKLNEYLNENNISKLELKRSDNISFENLSIDILAPESNKTIKSTDIANSNSMVIHMKITDNINSKSLLFMGDSTIETESTLLNIISSDEKEILKNLDIIQIGHHGSKTSTSEIFLKNIKVKEAIISSKKKVYGHPSAETLSKLEKYNIKYHITENTGAIKFKL